MFFDHNPMGERKKEKEENQALSTNVEYAPDNVGFIACSPDKFTYFANSDQGKEKHFGLTPANTKKLLKGLFPLCHSNIAIN